MNGVIWQRGINECCNHVALWRRMPFGPSHYRPDADGTPKCRRSAADPRKIGVNKQRCALSVCVFALGCVRGEELKGAKVFINADET